MFETGKGEIEFSKEVMDISAQISDGGKSKRRSILEWFDNMNIVSEKGTAISFFKMATEKREMRALHDDWRLRKWTR